VSQWGRGCRVESRRRLVYAPFSVLGHLGPGMRPFFSLYYDPMKIFGLSQESFLQKFFYHSVWKVVCLDGVTVAGPKVEGG
jgi:hypothetical protein